jgi:hypothetical protein
MPTLVTKKVMGCCCPVFRGAGSCAKARYVPISIITVYDITTDRLFVISLSASPVEPTADND